MANTKLPWNGVNTEIEYHRKPTAYEIKLGYGAIHYRSFSKDEFLKKDGTVKSRIKAKNDGLIYRR